MRFEDLNMGDTFTFTCHSSQESYEVVGPHQARRVNASEVRNVADHEQVSLLGTEAGRLEAERCALERWND